MEFGFIAILDKGWPTVQIRYSKLAGQPIKIPSLAMIADEKLANMILAETMATTMMDSTGIGRTKKDAMQSESKVVTKFQGNAKILIMLRN